MKNPKTPDQSNNHLHFYYLIERQLSLVKQPQKSTYKTDLDFFGGSGVESCKTNLGFWDFPS